MLEVYQLFVFMNMSGNFSPKCQEYQEGICDLRLEKKPCNKKEWMEYEKKIKN